MSDLRVSATLGLTIPLPGDRFGNVKPELRIDGIDPEGDVEAQLQLALAAGEKAWIAIDGNMNVVVGQLLSPNAGVPTPLDRIEALEKTASTAKRNIATVTEKMKEMIPQLAQAIASQTEVKTFGSDTEAPAGT